MSMYDAFMAAENANSFEELSIEANPDHQTQPWGPVDNTLSAWVERYNQLVDRPKFNPNIDGFISPFSFDHWGASSDIMQGLAAKAEALNSDRLDPNKIFTSDIAQLKTIAASHAKVVRVFEHQLMGSLTEKGKVGLNEDDIEAMQALNSAQSTLANITKEQIAVKKAIAELKIKQQQAAGGAAQESGGGGRALSAFDIGRSIMDNIFDTPSVPQSNQTVITNYPAVDTLQAERVIDNLVNVGDIADTVKFEADAPKTMVVVDRNGGNPEFVTYASNGEELPDFPNPTAAIQTIDPSTGKAVDELLQEYDIKYRDE